MFKLAIIVTACNFQMSTVGPEHKPVCKEVVAYEQDMEYAVNPLQCIIFAQQNIAYKWHDDPKNQDWQITRVTCNPNYKRKQDA
jgi:hypothetical protein